MKFSVQVKDFARGLEPVVSVAVKGVTKEYENAFFTTLIVDDNGITGVADGGKVSIYADISNSRFDKLNFKHEVNGIATVKAADLKAVLASIDENEIINVEVTGDDDAGRELMFTLESDPEQFQTLPINSENIPRDRYIDDYMEAVNDDDGLQIRRDLFASGASALTFTHGFEEYRPAYLYWVIRASKDELRFASGSGGRFAVLEYIGHDLSNATDTTTLVVPNEQTQVFVDIVGKVSDEMITLHKTDRHLVLKTSNFIAVASNYDPEIEWPDLDVFLKRDNTLRLTTRVGSWPNAVKGLAATYNEDAKKAFDYHVANLDIDLAGNIITAKTTGSTMRSKRKINIEDAEVKDSDSMNTVNLNFLSKYLFEAFKNASDDEHVQIEIENELKPVVIRYHAGQQVGESDDFRKPNESFGVDERFTVFFATFTEDD